MPVAMRLNSVNWLSAIATRTTKTTRIVRRRRKRRRVLVDRETCETCGAMDRNLAVGEGVGGVPGGAKDVEAPPAPFPYATWGPQLAVGGLLLALGAGILLGIPALIVDNPSDGDLSTEANVIVQLATALGFLLVPLAIASRWGEASLGEALQRLGVRRFDGEAVGWMVVAVIAYLAFAAAYIAIFGSPEQEDIADSFGTWPLQVLLIAIAAPVSEEICFRGMVFGGLRTRMPLIAAALVSGLIFGLLHALTGLSAVPPLIAFGFILALLYEKTGSILPGIILHMLNNAVALIGQ
jgi:membrane protease YdiL (CAAX protease family)